MGRVIPKGVQLSHVQVKISRKLNQWSRSKLSFVGRVLIVNEVILATLGHSVSCWIMDPASVHVIKAAMRALGFMLDYEPCKSTCD